MYSHEPQNYNCPFCNIVKGIEDEQTFTNQADIICRDEFVMAFIASHWWPNNKGHVIVVPNDHIENIYLLPDFLSDKIHRVEKNIALALKEKYQCDGISVRQHNEPCGGQDVWHYYVHVFPRYKDDNLYTLDSQRYLSGKEERIPFARKLKEYFDKKQQQ